MADNDRVAERIVATKKQGNDVVVVVPAMGIPTTCWIWLSRCARRRRPELDMLLPPVNASECVGGHITESLGAHARSFTGSQAGVITTGTHGNAKIIDVTPGGCKPPLRRGGRSFAAGFQGGRQDTADADVGPRRLGHHRRRHGRRAGCRCL